MAAPVDSTAAFTISGEFTIFTADSTKTRLLDAIHQATTADIEVDLSDVTEIDSAGLQLMVMAKREAAEHGRSVSFTGHSAPVLDLIDLCGLSGFFGDPILISSKA
jgi:anti-anti-sigma factor